jgi:hypothetical protein
VCGRRRGRPGGIVLVPVEDEGTPLSRRGEGYLVDRRLLLSRQRLRDRLAGLVAGRRAGDETAQPVPQVIVADPKGSNVRKLQAVRGQRARLVEAERIDVAQRLDGIGLLYERALAGHPHGAERVCDHDRQQEPLRHQTDNHHQPLYQLDKRVAPGDGANGQHHHQEGRHQERQPYHPVDLALQRRQDATLGAGTGGDLVGEAVLADLPRLEAGAAGDAKASREKLVACPLADQVRLAGQLRLVHLHRSVAHHGPIDDDLVSRTDAQQVAAHDLARIDALLATVTNNLRRRAGQKGDLVELALGAHLLKNAHSGVR